MHRIDCAAGCVRGDGGEKRRIEDPEPDLLSLHVAASNAETLVDWITIRLCPPAQQDAADKQGHHRCPHGPTVLLILNHAAEVVSESGANREDRQHLDKIRKRRWILERM